jgi:hypothetical protein
MLIAEDQLLLLTDDASGKFAVDGNALNLALAGACVLELAEQGRIDVAAEGEQVKKGRLVVRDEASTGDAILDEVLARCADREGKRPQSVLSGVGKGVRASLLDRLADRGILTKAEGRVLGIFPTTRWPASDSAHERAVHARLEDVLVKGASPDPRTAALAALLSAVDAAHKVVPSSDRRGVKRRAKEIRESEWAADAVGKAITAVQAAVTASIVTSISAGVAASN